ncbi:hypothetical protein DIPPA_17505 [Diplonema papillatum]|nr:hypothetical protein DIPPA_17505 [Diplonema papillatum]
MDDLYTFEPPSFVGDPVLDELKPKCPKTGRRAQANAAPAETCTYAGVEPSKGEKEPDNADVDAMGKRKEEDKRLQEAMHKAKLAEKRAERTGVPSEQEMYRQQAQFNSKLAEKRASRGRLPVSEHTPTNRSLPPDNPPGVDALASLSNGAYSCSPQTSPICRYSKSPGMREWNLNEKGEANTYVASYEKLVQESEYEASLARKRLSKRRQHSVTEAMANAPPNLGPTPEGDSLDALRQHICLSDGRGASPEPVMPSPKRLADGIAPWKNPQGARGIK